ncbi:MAG: hypothetical protein H7268_01345 [Sandarakinorhabdus sp.]|nr:hypothetical protein [Sandarakinorhabdus sp.]
MTATGTITFPTPTTNAGAGPLPVKVRTADGETVGWGVSGSPISVAPGQYFVSIVMPDGRERTSGEMVEVQPGGDSAPAPMEARVAAAPPPLSFAAAEPMAAPSPGFESDADVGAPHSRAVSRGMPDDMARDAAPDAAPAAAIAGAAPDGQCCVGRLWRGDWFAAWDSAALAAAGRTAPDLALALGADFTLSETAPLMIDHVPGLDTMFSMRIGAATRYAVVPYDECAACVGEAPNPRTIATRLVTGPAGPAARFRSSIAEEANTLLAFVENGVLTEMWTVSEDMINQGERAMYGAGSSILRAVTGAYVLLRANHLDGLDAWLRTLAEAAPSLPDIAILRVEMLARLGMHEDALALLHDAIGGRCPWFRSGLSYMLERVRLYIDVSANTDVPFQISDGELPRFVEARDRLDRLMRVLVRGQVMSTFDVPD